MSHEEKAQLYSRLEKIDANMSRVLNYLESDSKTMQTGLVERVSQLQQEVDMLKFEKSMFLAKAGVWATFGSFFALVIVWIIKQVVDYLMR